jgi:Fe-S-cluster containining protein
LQRLTMTRIPDCIGCGKCCTKYVVLDSSDKVPNKFVESVDGLQYMRRRDGYCIAFNRRTRSCSIYEQRPLVCILFERGSPECMDTLVDVP